MKTLNKIQLNRPLLRTYTAALVAVTYSFSLLLADAAFAVEYQQDNEKQPVGFNLEDLKDVEIVPDNQNAIHGLIQQNVIRSNDPIDPRVGQIHVLAQKIREFDCDFDSNGVVDEADVSAAALQYAKALADTSFVPVPDIRTLDLNHDGKLNNFDINLVQQSLIEPIEAVIFAQAFANDLLAGSRDFNHDGRVDMRDVAHATQAFTGALKYPSAHIKNLSANQLAVFDQSNEGLLNSFDINGFMQNVVRPLEAFVLAQNGTPAQVFVNFFGGRIHGF